MRRPGFWALAAAAAAPVVGGENLNGAEYVVTATDAATREYNCDYASKGHEYFDVYSPPITTQYGQVYWTMQDPVDLPDAIVARFHNSTIAITGYEVDQVVRGEASDGSDDVSVPITHAYNHHYGAWLSGEGAELVDAPCSPSEHMWMMRADGSCPTYRAKHTEEEEEEEEGASSTSTSTIPTSQFFSEGNGGEFRKSFHGYPAGTAQLVDKPRVFTVSPMQIDTYNRDYPHTSKFVVGPLPREAQGPSPTAGPFGGLEYSPLLECPCTDRLFKRINRTYATKVEGEGCDSGAAVANATECWTAVTKALQGSGVAVASTSEVSDESLPLGCSFRRKQQKHDDTPTTGVNAYFNTAATGIACGGGDSDSDNDNDNEPPALVAGSVSDDSTGVIVAVSLRPAANAANITISGPAEGWLGVGFGARQMGDTPYAIIVAGDGANASSSATSAAEASESVVGWNVMERKLDDHAPGRLLDPSVTVLSHTVDASNGLRTVVLSRPMDLGKSSSGDYSSSDYFTFDVSDEASVNLITALGSSPVFAYHKAHGNAELSLIAEDDASSATCVCFAGTYGEICGNAVGGGGGDDAAGGSDNCIAFPTSGEQMGEGQPLCPEQPTSDLSAFGNPTCDVATYSGGLRCCHHLNTLLDADQPDPWPEQPLEYSLKFRFWFQDYVPAVAAGEGAAGGRRTAEAGSASHHDLPRLYWQTESFAGEYDVPRGDLGMPGTDWDEDNQMYTYTITSTFAAADILYDCPSDPPTCGHSAEGDGIGGLELVYAGPHCHAPSCLFMELWDDDSGALLCRVEPIWGGGRTHLDKFDEKGYAAIPPCLWGSGDAEEDDGAFVLPKRPYLAFNTTLRSVAVQNSTFGHYGQMASWQMRGFFS